MATTTLSADEQALFDTLPTTGEIEFDDWRDQLYLARKIDLLDAHYHPMRRAKKIAVRIDKSSGVGKSMVSRPTVS